MASRRALTPASDSLHPFYSEDIEAWLAERRGPASR